MSKLSLLRQGRDSIAITLFLAGTVIPAHAQTTFQSGSTGADGPFQPTTSGSVNVPESGVFNFTTITIPQGVTVTFVPSAKNTPVALLTTGDVTINGTINIAGKDGNANGTGGAGGPGGFRGGTSGYGTGASFAGLPGDGPGSGSGGGSANGANLAGGGGGGFGAAGGNGTGQNANAVVGKGGVTYGTHLLLPLVGGSGGGGGGAKVNARGGPGGGGGGAILIASSTAIRFGPQGAINARGGAGLFGFDGGGGGGAGGAIRLIANTISGGGALNVQGGGCFNCGLVGGNGGFGYIRVEAFDSSTYNPDSSGRQVSFGVPNPVTLPNAPQLRIASVAGVPAPASPVGSLYGPTDIVVPATQTNPVEVAIEASNVPVGKVVQVTLIPPIGTPSTVNSGPLAGTQEASSATASVTLPPGMSALFATATVDLTAADAQALSLEGEQVERMEVTAAYSRGSELTYITQSGRRIPASALH